jgi:Na+/H+ antiporter NhaD/arsenite permease-like protein
MLLNEFIDKFMCVSVMSFYVSICMIYVFYNNDHMVKSTKKNIN